MSVKDFSFYDLQIHYTKIMFDEIMRSIDKWTPTTVKAVPKPSQLLAYNVSFISNITRRW